MPKGHPTIAESDQYISFMIFSHFSDGRKTNLFWLNAAEGMMVCIINMDKAILRSCPNGTIIKLHKAPHLFKPGCFFKIVGLDKIPLLIKNGDPASPGSY